MTGFEIRINDHSACCFEQYLYNTPLHLSFQPSQNLYHFSLVNKQNGICHARIHYFVEDNKALSSYKAPFGSVQFAEDLGAEDLYQFINQFENYCRDLKLKEIEVTSYPFCYNPDQSQLLFNCFIRAGFKVNFLDLNFHFDPTIDFESNLHRSAKRRLKKCQQKGYIFEKQSKESLKVVYDLYVKSRSFTGIPVTMSYDKLDIYFNNFPDQYLIFTVRDGAKIIAATICIKPLGNILYNFLPCDDPSYRNDSPMVLMIQGIVEYCDANDISIFDLGTASIKGHPQISLMKFKQNLGAKLSVKPQFKKLLL